MFYDNVKIQHVTASFLPGHVFGEGVHNVLYIATDADGNKVRHVFMVDFDYSLLQLRFMYISK